MMAIQSNKVKLKDIAEAANLSVSTVSMALANRPQINEETKIRIREISQKMGYNRSKRLGRVPTSTNDGSRNNAFRATKRFGYMLIGSSLEDEAAIVLVHRLANYAKTIGVRLEFSSAETFVPAVEQFTKQVETHVVEQTLQFAQGLDGLILCGYVTHNLIDKLNETGMPFVNVGGIMDNGLYLSKPVCHIVSSNWSEAGRNSVKQLIQWGHRHIAYFTEQTPTGMCNDLLLQGYRMALLEGKLPISDAYVHITGRAFTGGAPAAEAFLKLEPRPTGFFCPDIRIGSSFMNVMREKGFEIGQHDIVLCGHWDVARKYHVEHYPIIEEEDSILAEASLRRLADLWDRPWPFPSITFVPYTMMNF